MGEDIPAGQPIKVISNIMDKIASCSNVKAKLILAQWDVYWKLFGADLLLVVEVQPQDGELWLEKINGPITNGQYTHPELFQYVCQFDEEYYSEKFDLMASVYQAPDHFNGYLNLLHRAPYYLYLLPSMVNLSSEQQQDIKKTSINVIERAVSSDVFSGSTKLYLLCKLYLCLLEFGLDVEALLFFKKIIFENLHAMEAGDKTLVALLRKCNLLPLAQEQRFHLYWQLRDSRASFAVLVDVWQGQKSARASLKVVFPEMRHGHYPFTKHELTAGYFEQSYEEGQGSLKQIWLTVFENGYYKHLGKESTHGHWCKALTAAYAMSNNRDFRKEVLDCLQQEAAVLSNEQGVQQHWWDQEAWQDGSLLEAVILRNNLLAFKELLSAMCDAGKPFSFTEDTIIAAARSGCAEALSHILSLTDNVGASHLYGKVVEKALAEAMDAEQSGVIKGIFSVISGGVLKFDIAKDTMVRALIMINERGGELILNQCSDLAAVKPPTEFQTNVAIVAMVILGQTERAMAAINLLVSGTVDAMEIALTADAMRIALLAAVRTKNWRAVECLYAVKAELSRYIMSGLAFNEVARSGDEAVFRAVMLRMSSLPVGAFFNEIREMLEIANESGKGFILEEYINIKDQGNTSSFWISVSFLAAVIRGRLDSVQNIMKGTSPKVDKIVLREGFIVAVKQGNAAIINAILEVLFVQLGTERSFLWQKAFKEAARYNQVGAVGKMLDKVSDQVIDEEQVCEVLREATEKCQWPLVVILAKFSEKTRSLYGMGWTSSLIATAKAGDQHTFFIIMGKLGNHDSLEYLSFMGDALIAAKEAGQQPILDACLRFKNAKNPPNIMLGEALIAAVVLGRLDDVKEILIRLKDESAQKSVEAALDVSVKMHAWEMAEIMVTLQGNAQPGWFYVNKTLYAAVEANAWPMVHTIIAITGDSMPDGDEVRVALRAAAQQGRVDTVKMILDIRGENQPWPIAVREALEMAMKENQQHVLEECLGFKDEENPDELQLTVSLIAAIILGRGEVVSSILSSLNIRGLDLDNMIEAAVNAKQWGVLEIIVDNIIQINEVELDLGGEVEPGLGGEVEPGLGGEVESDLDGEVESSSDGEVESDSDDEAELDLDDTLTAVAEAQQWRLVEKIIPLNKGDDHLETATNVFVAANEAGEHQVLRTCVAFKDEADSAAFKINLALIAAVVLDDVDAIEVMLNMTTENKPDVSAIDEALELAAGKGKIAIVEKILAGSEDNRPTPYGIANAFGEAADNDQLEIEKLFLTRYPLDAYLNNAFASATNMEILVTIVDVCPSKVTLKESAPKKLDYALNKHQWPLVEWLMEFAEVGIIQKEAVGRVFKQAMNAYEWAVVKRVLSLPEDKMPKLEAMGDVCKMCEVVARAGEQAIVEKMLELTQHDQAMVALVRSKLPAVSVANNESQNRYRLSPPVGNSNLPMDAGVASSPAP